MIRHPCTNVSNMTYSGKEFSPLGFGISAEGHDLNSILTGRDTLKWIVKMKNNRKVWVRYENKITTMVHEEHNQNITNSSDDTEKKDDNILAENTSKTSTEPKKMNNYLKYLTKRKEVLNKEYNGSKTSKEIYNQILSEWKELKSDTKKYNEIMQTL